MKFLIIGDKTRTEKYLPDLPLVDTINRVVLPRGSSDEEILAAASDAEFIMADAISPVSATLINGMPQLKLIHSEGVAYNLIDLEAAQKRNVPVCNNKGVNAGAVAEQTVLLMLACLRDAINCHNAVYDGQQIQTKERMMVEGIRELGDCSIGFIGFGDIAQATACRLKPWGCTMRYYRRNQLNAQKEHELGVSYANQDTVIAASDIVSLHTPVTGETRGMVDTSFLARMKPGSILINTARGEIVNQDALAFALINGTLARAGLDTLDPEPVTSDNALLNLPDKAARKLILSPHIGGITEGMFKRAHHTVWENIARVINEEEPINRIV